MVPNGKIEIDAKTAEVLEKHATTLGLSIAEYLARHFRQIDGKAIEDPASWLDELSEGLDHLQPLPADFSTSDAYTDHD